MCQDIGSTFQRKRFEISRVCQGTVIEFSEKPFSCAENNKTMNNSITSSDNPSSNSKDEEQSQNSHQRICFRQSLRTMQTCRGNGKPKPLMHLLTVPYDVSSDEEENAGNQDCMPNGSCSARTRKISKSGANKRRKSAEKHISYSSSDNTDQDQIEDEGNRDQAKPKEKRTINGKQKNQQHEDVYEDFEEDYPDMNICLSKIHKSMRIELSEDRMSAGNKKGFRMVKATRWVDEGAWYFEIKVVSLGETGHTRLGWASGKAGINYPVGFGLYSYGFRDIDGSKVHEALRTEYASEGYRDGDVIGCYINLPSDPTHISKSDSKPMNQKKKPSSVQDHFGKTGLEVLPDSEISFFKNGICQGIAFNDIYAGQYYPAASMFTLPRQPTNCTVKFNFGPDFDCYPEDFGDRPLPKSMYEVPYRAVQQQPIQSTEHLEQFQASTIML